MNKLCLFFLVCIQSLLYSENVFFADCKNFYNRKNAELFLPVLLPSIICANSPYDQHIYDFYKDRIRSDNTDKLSKVAKIFGSNKPLSIAFFSSMAASYFLKKTSISKPLYDFSLSSFRAVTVALPSLIVMQNVFGADRPNQKTNSYYHPFKNDHAVSGHAFMGSVPFITAAFMSENKFIKGAFFIASTATGISRINDGSHYPSQVLLGWMLGYCACNAVSESSLEGSVDLDKISFRYKF